MYLGTAYLSFNLSIFHISNINFIPSNIKHQSSVGIMTSFSRSSLFYLLLFAFSFQALSQCNRFCYSQTSYHGLCDVCYYDCTTTVEVHFSSCWHQPKEQTHLIELTQSECIRICHPEVMFQAKTLMKETETLQQQMVGQGEDKTNLNYISKQLQANSGLSQASINSVIQLQTQMELGKEQIILAEEMVSLSKEETVSKEIQIQQRILQLTIAAAVGCGIVVFASIILINKYLNNKDLQKGKSQQNNSEKADEPQWNNDFPDIMQLNNCDSAITKCSSSSIKKEIHL